MTPPTTIGTTAYGAPITFTDRRTWKPPAQIIEDPGSLDSALVKKLDTAMVECPRHEARHAAVGLLLDFTPVEARADIPEDNILGRVKFDEANESWTRLRLAEDAVMTIAGHLGEQDERPVTWPLRTDGNATGDEQHLGRVVAQLNLSEKQFNGLVGIARTIVEHPAIVRATDHIETLLGVGMTLDRRMLKDLYEFGLKDAAPPTTEELEQAIAVKHAREHHRDSMLSYLKACDEYRKQEDIKALRERSERIAREFGLEII